MTTALRHDWRAIVQYRLSDDEARQMIKGYGHPEVDDAPITMLATGERPAVGDPRVFLGTHNLLREESAIVCWRCENGWTPELAAEPCPGADGSPLADLAGALSDAPPLGNVPTSNLRTVGRNEPCP